VRKVGRATFNPDGDLQLQIGGALDKAHQAVKTPPAGPAVWANLEVWTGSE